jgi:DNA polymerase-3 subunit gamma/tau
MLSRNAFNALLKTLEEPPAHAKFIFATTEIRKVPVTVLSRCQRFDLRRVDIEALSMNFKQIAEAEGVEITDGAIALIAGAANGSVRDGQSLLDQVIATGIQEPQALSEESVREMLGLINRENSFDLLESVMSGNIAGALEQLDYDYANGADPILILQDLLDIIHWLARVKITPKIADSALDPEIDLKRSINITNRLPMAALTRAWQMLLKGLNEAQTSSVPIHAVEMILIRLAYLADLPTPADLVEAIAKPDKKVAEKISSPTKDPTGVQNSGTQSIALINVKTDAIADSEPQLKSLPNPKTFEDVIHLADKMNERILCTNLINNVHLIRFKPGAIEFQPGKNLPREFSHELTRFLNRATDRRWVVTISLDEEGEETHQQRKDNLEVLQIKEVSQTPFVQSVLEVFPGAEISEVRDIKSGPESLKVIVDNKDNT